MATIHNPVLTGFNPDPSLLCVGEDWYIATSTFEWFPGVQLHHSRDLAHWELLPRPVCRESQLALSGAGASGGVWAPCLSYCDGVFYLVYSNVHTFGKTFYDVKNYLITAQNINGPWSDPVFLNSGGFDASLFHDTDGRKWLLHMDFDYRPWKVRFAGIAMQEYSEREHRLTGVSKRIWNGSSRRTVEGPHLYHINGWYYLLCAEGGTTWRHCATVLRSKAIDGPYEQSPFDPLVTSQPYPLNPLQKAGHASMAQGPDGRWYLAHLCGRPVGADRECILGRETALQELTWQDGWPRLAAGDNEPRVTFEAPYPNTLPEDTVYEGGAWRDNFDGFSWSIHFQSLRTPLGARASLTDNPGFLRLYGAESPESLFEQTLLAARQQHLHCSVETALLFAPESYRQTAGLIYYYDGASYFYLCISRDEEKGRVLTLMCKQLDVFTMPLGVGIPLPETGRVGLRLITQGETAQFYYQADNADWQAVGGALPATVLSDDHYENNGAGNRFTGAFIGICCQDISGGCAPADFDFFAYTPLES